MSGKKCILRTIFSNIPFRILAPRGAKDDLHDNSIRLFKLFLFVDERMGNFLNIYFGMFQKNYLFVA